MQDINPEGTSENHHRESPRMTKLLYKEREKETADIALLFTSCSGKVSMGGKVCSFLHGQR